MPIVCLNCACAGGKLALLQLRLWTGIISAEEEKMYVVLFVAFVFKINIKYNNVVEED